MDTLGIEATPEEVDLMIDEIDQDNNGEIDFEGEYTYLTWGEDMPARMSTTASAFRRHFPHPTPAI